MVRTKFRIVPSAGWWKGKKMLLERVLELCIVILLQLSRSFIILMISFFLIISFCMFDNLKRKKI